MVTQRRPPTPARPSRPRPSGPSAGGGAEPGRIDPELLQRRVGNLFSAGRAGRPAVRPDDLLALRIELSNLVVTPGDPPRLERASPSGAAALVVHLPPQSIAEETFFQTAPPGTSNPPPPKPGTPQASEPSGNEDPVAPPVRARIAGESRLAFSVPPGFSVPYTLEGVLQVAPFHPRFQFEGTEADDITNATNRAPYPTLHLLREDSIDKAVEAYPEAEMIYERNMQTLEDMGLEAWLDLDLGPRCPITGRTLNTPNEEK